LQPFVHMPVSVLCVASNSIYKHIEGIEVYDQTRDARTFPGGMLVVAHLSCRACQRIAGIKRSRDREKRIWVRGVYRWFRQMEAYSNIRRTPDYGMSLDCQDLERHP
jgi:hypothetical protein